MEFFLNKEKDQVMKTKEKLCQKQLFNASDMVRSTVQLVATVVLVEERRC